MKTTKQKKAGYQEIGPVPENWRVIETKKMTVKCNHVFHLTYINNELEDRSDCNCPYCKTCKETFGTAYDFRVHREMHEAGSI